MPVARAWSPSGGLQGFGGRGANLGGGFYDRRLGRPAGAPEPHVLDVARAAQRSSGELFENRGKMADRALAAPSQESNSSEYGIALREAGEKKKAYDQAQRFLAGRRQEEVQTGKLGVDLSIDANNLRNQNRLSQTAIRKVAGRNCLEYGGVWIDEEFNSKTPTITVKAMSDAYFRILERQPQVKEVFQLGNYLVWITPSGTALVIDTNDGKEKLSDAEIDKLFIAKK
jgi:Ca-activated chloride channel family protein